MSKLLYFSPAAKGGLADYAHAQATALVNEGVTVRMVTVEKGSPSEDCEYEVSHLTSPQVNGYALPLVRKLFWVRCVLKNLRLLEQEIRHGKHTAVLFGSYFEYLAPFWASRFRALARGGIVFGAVVHDPVRDYVVGPRWWHKRSVAAAYSFLREAFVHEEIQLDTVCPMLGLRSSVIPHGPYCFPKPTETRAQARERLCLPDATQVALSFGHIRDGKNLALVIRAMTELPSVYLVIAGKEQSSSQKPIIYYQELARSLGVADRCRWIHGHIPETEVGNLFTAADLILLTYSRDFRSASGVLNAAVNYRKPCLASSGGGNLRSVVERYGLGWFVEPDNLAAVTTGFETAANCRINPAWETYESENSWERNAQIVKEKMFGSTK